MEQITATITINIYGKECKKDITFISNPREEDRISIRRWAEELLRPFEQYEELLKSRKRDKAFRDWVEQIVIEEKSRQQAQAQTAHTARDRNA